MSTPTAQVTAEVSASADKIWEALTTPAKLKTFFFGSDIDSDFDVGSPIRMSGEFEGKRYEDKGEILEVRPGKRLSFSHWSAMSGQPDSPENYHVVTFDLEPKADATQVTLTQSNLKGGVTDSDKEHRAEYEKNWKGVLDGLAKQVAD